jgi:hypothetical protein
VKSSGVQLRAATPWWFWAFAIALLLLSLAGVAQLPQQYLSSEEELSAQLPPALFTIMQAEPWWAATGYAVGLVAGLLGALCLFAPRTRTLVPVLGVSIAGFLIQRAWFFLLSDLTHLLPPVASITLFAIVGLNLTGIWMARRG